MVKTYYTAAAALFTSTLFALVSSTTLSPTITVSVPETDMRVGDTFFPTITIERTPFWAARGVVLRPDGIEEVTCRLMISGDYDHFADTGAYNPEAAFNSTCSIPPNDIGDPYKMPCYFRPWQPGTFKFHVVVTHAYGANGYEQTKGDNKVCLSRPYNSEVSNSTAITFNVAAQDPNTPAKIMSDLSSGPATLNLSPAPTGQVYKNSATRAQMGGISVGVSLLLAVLLA